MIRIILLYVIFKSTHATINKTISSLSIGNGITKIAFRLNSNYNFYCCNSI
ncbi:hypothetical protein I4U23_018306 [Adineta vaga]|nr:hypothetical protein I4U23_018306 [Adineta vaga]